MLSPNSWLARLRREHVAVREFRDGWRRLSKWQDNRRVLGPQDSDAPDPTHHASPHRPTQHHEERNTP